MTPTKLFRIGSILLFVAAAGNTYGFLVFRHVAGRMPSVRFPSGHSGLSYAQVVLGYELFASLCVLFAAYLAWHLGTLARTTPQAIGALGWLLFVYQLVGFYISLIFLSGFVRILAAVVAICIGWASLLVRSERLKLARAE
jgi:hypothetical protein